jgi:hypothetical protein
MACDWTPKIQPGGIYCSPRCGGRCKRVDYDRAVTDAAALAARMGDGWQPKVWENLGWHWQIEKGTALDGHAVGDALLEINPNRGGGYTAWFQGAKQFIAEGQTPEDALGFLMQDVRTFIRRIEDELKTAA